MLPRLSVLFLCTGNSCRSQMAEAWTRKLHPEWSACSAGTNPGRLDPRADHVMADLGTDISSQRSKHLDEMSGIPFDWVITVCDSVREARPRFPGRARLLHAEFDAPPRLAAGAISEEAALAPHRRVRDEIHDYVSRLPDLLSMPVSKP